MLSGLHVFLALLSDRVNEAFAQQRFHILGNLVLGCAARMDIADQRQRKDRPDNARNFERNLLARRKLVDSRLKCGLESYWS